MPFIGYLDDTQSPNSNVLRFNTVDSITTNTSSAHIDYLYNIKTIYPMTLFIRSSGVKKTVGLELTFPGKLITSKVKKAPTFIYKWSNNSITIRRLLATTQLKEIKRQAHKLLYECERFNFIYCTQKI
jgi:hypothetical protein